jgi:hypothetical protein
MNKHQKMELIGAIVLVLCVILVAGWMIAAKVAAQPFDELRLKAEDFTGFTPRSDQWSIRLVHVKASPTEPTVIAFALRGRSASKAEIGNLIRLRGETSPGQEPEMGTGDDERVPLPTSHFPRSSPLLVRIVHGYNMVDCMRIKQYTVQVLADTRSDPPTVSPSFPSLPSTQAPPFQMWKLTSTVDESSIWLTTMLRAADFAATKVDTRDMAFPRVGTPDDPSWAPTGLKWSSFRHPIRNARLALRARWNASRRDIWTFLRLRQPAWASDEMLTMVTEYRGPSVMPEQEAAVAQYALQAHQFMLGEFQRFWKGRQND